MSTIVGQGDPVVEALADQHHAFGVLQEASRWDQRVTVEQNRHRNNAGRPKGMRPQHPG